MSGMVIKLDGGKTIEDIRKEVDAFKVSPENPDNPNVPAVPAVDPNAPAKPQGQATPPAPEQTPPTGGKEPQPQQPKEPAKEADQGKPKAAEPAKEVDWQARYKGAAQERDKTVAAKEKEIAELRAQLEAKAQAKTEPEIPINLTPEIKKKIVEDAEKDFPGTIVKLVREIVQGEIHPIKSKLSASEAAVSEKAKFDSLQKMVDAGDDWITTEAGAAKFDAVFAAHPELDNLPPSIKYVAARSFITDVPSKAGPSGSAPSTGLTPMLGASGAMPPSGSTQVVSKQEKLGGLLNEMDLYLKRGNIQKAQEIKSKIDEIERGY